MALSASAADERAAARSTAVEAITAAGLGDLAEEARAAAVAYMDRVYTSGGFHPTWVAPNWGLSTGPIADRVAATAAVEDAALATIGDGIAPDDVVDTLRAPFELIAAVHPMPAGGDAVPTLGEIRRLGPVWGTVAVLAARVRRVGWFLGEWPILVAAAIAVIAAVGLWLRQERGSTTS